MTLMQSFAYKWAEDHQEFIEQHMYAFVLVSMSTGEVLAHDIQSNRLLSIQKDLNAETCVFYLGGLSKSVRIP
jgi:hypothetical protein